MGLCIVSVITCQCQTTFFLLISGISLNFTPQQKKFISSVNNTNIYSIKPPKMWNL